MPCCAEASPALGRAADEGPALSHVTDLTELMAAVSTCIASRAVSYSRKVFIPLTHLRRRLWLLYFHRKAAQARRPCRARRCSISPARARRLVARKRCSHWATSPNCVFPTMWTRLHSLLPRGQAALVLKENGGCCRIHPGLMDEAWATRLRAVSVSQGIMLETGSDRLVAKKAVRTTDRPTRCQPCVSPPWMRLAERRLRSAPAWYRLATHRGPAGHPRHARKARHRRSSFRISARRQADERMAAAPEPSVEEHLWTIAAARPTLVQP